jgi:NAD(P)-dependent dehydrogenase (short-subunit alcohol dehydrogenase family)
VAQKKKTVIVTGGSQGIGAGLVKTFLDRGYNVAANSRNITRSRAFEASDSLALVDGSLDEAMLRQDCTHLTPRKDAQFTHARCPGG